MAINQYEIGNFKNFSYLIYSDGEAFIVDPQRDTSPWRKDLAELNLKLKGVLLTHGHWDHIGGCAEIARRDIVPVYIHEKENFRLVNEPIPVHDNLHNVSDGEVLTLGKLSIEVIHTPGHSAGGVCYLITGEAQEPALISGDTVFVGDVGRTDLDTGSSKQLMESLVKLSLLNEKTVIYPGHNYGKSVTSTIGHEKEFSPSWKAQTIEEFDAI